MWISKGEILRSWLCFVCIYTIQIPSLARKCAAWPHIWACKVVYDELFHNTHDMCETHFVECIRDQHLHAIQGYIVEVMEAAEQEVFDDPDTGKESIGGTEVVKAILEIDPDKPRKEAEDIVRQAAGVAPGEEILGQDFDAQPFLDRLKKVFLRRSTSLRKPKEKADPRMPTVDAATPVI